MICFKSIGEKMNGYFVYFCLNNKIVDFVVVVVVVVNES